MNASPNRQMPARYDIRIGENLDQHWSAWFDDLALTPEADGTTKLSGFVADQAALHGVLTKIRDLGLVLISTWRPWKLEGPSCSPASLGCPGPPAWQAHRRGLQA